MKNIFEYIFSKSSLFLFLVGLTLAIILTASFSYLSINHPMLLINAEPSEFDFFKSTTTLGKFYMFSGILPNFLFLIIIYRFIKYIVLTIFELLEGFFKILGSILESILGLIFSKENFDRLENWRQMSKPKVEKKIKKAIKKINFKKNEKNVFWLAPIIALGIGILPLPIGYYMLSRLIVSGCALYFAHKFYKKKQPLNFGFLDFLLCYIIQSLRYICMKKQFGF